MSQADLISTTVSAGFVLIMVSLAALLGFRKSARLDASELARLAAAEGARVQAAALDERGRAGLAKLEGGKLLAAKVMADGISARVVGQREARVRSVKRGVSVTFGDLGYPSLNMRLENPPAWLSELGAKS
jgi:hypothetical protein